MLKTRPSMLASLCIAGGMLVAGTTTAMAQEPVELVSLEPLDSEYGLLEAHFRSENMVGPDKFHAGAFHIQDAGVFWPENVKIVAELDEDAVAEVEESQAEFPYISTNTKVFFVDREPKTGVGLWVKLYAMYHWIDFEIPEGATRITGLVLTTDDSVGYMRHSHKKFGGHNFTWSVHIDGEEVFKSESYDRAVVPYGKGQVVGELNVEIPEDAEVITFELTSGGHVDWSKNTEIVIHDALFEFD